MSLGEAARIVVVEDNRDTAALLRDLLVTEGYEVESVPTGEAALESLDREPIDPAALTEATSGMLPKEADAYFRAERIEAGDTLDQGFSIVLVTGGEGTIGDLAVRRGSTVLVPYAAGTVETQGVEGLRCLPPDPTAEATW